MPVGVMYHSPSRKRVVCSQSTASLSTRTDDRLTTKASPRARKSPASEAMNGWTSKYCTRTPMSRPIAAPPRMIAGITTAAGWPAASRSAQRMPVKAITEPTERSMPPVTMTKVIPTARISR